tara:strand:- start:1427 stop:1690 length:264 start_codon:yes stop_codon:yes gene_type:complete
MLKELKYLLFLFIISIFFFLVLKYYFSDENKKNSYRSYKEVNKKISNYSQKTILLKSDTDNIVEYVEKIIDKSKKNYNFWNLINNNE